MKVIVTLTVFDVTETVIKIFRNRLRAIENEFKWTIIKQTWGIHRQSSRAHTHIATVFDCGEGKVWKILQDKIKRSSAWRIDTQDGQLQLLQKELKVKISHRYSEDEDYDEDAALRYNFKEYETDDEMWNDVAKMGDDNNKLFKGVDNDEAETMRAVANKQYKAVKAKRAKDERDKLNKENKKMRLWDYIKSTEQFDPGNGIHCMIQQVICAILRFNKEEKTNFRINGLKDLAVNYLYHENLINELDICEYIKI